MQILIENYRGWDIKFDTDNETFSAILNENDKTEIKGKGSYASTKKYIDDYIKNNIKFQPIKVENFGSLFSSAKCMTIIGITKDNKFMVEESDGSKHRLSSYDEGNFFVYDSKNDLLKEELVALEEQRKFIGTQIEELKKQFTITKIADLRATLMPKN